MVTLIYHSRRALPKWQIFSKVCPSSRFCQEEVRKLRLYRNYFQLVFFLGKIRSAKTNSAVLQTGGQKFTFFRLCPLVGFRPTSLGAPPNYSLSLRLTTRKLYESCGRLRTVSQTHFDIYSLILRSMVTHLCHSSVTPPKQQSLESLGRSSLTSK